MDFKAIYERLRDQFGSEVVLDLRQSDLSDEKKPVVLTPPQTVVNAQDIRAVAAFLKDDEALRMDSLMCLSSVDRGESLSVVYHAHSLALGHKVCLRVDVPRRGPIVPTVEQVWTTANWHEREAYDMMGIVFDGHSDLRPILLPDGWDGHPLRKDYEVQEYYRGMKVPY